MITFSREILFGIVCCLLAGIFLFYNYLFRRNNAVERIFLNSLGVWMIWLSVIIGMLIKEIW